MLRKTIMALLAAGSIGLLSPTVASARGGFGGGGFHGRGGFHGGGFHGGGFRGAGIGLGLGLGLAGAPTLPTVIPTAMVAITIRRMPTAATTMEAAISCASGSGLPMVGGCVQSRCVTD